MGSTWGDLYRYALELQHAARKCAVTHNTLVGLIFSEREKLKAQDTKTTNKK